MVSAQNGAVNSTEWDIDLISEKNDWLIKVLGQEEIRKLPFIEELGENGTSVIWRNLDRLLEDTDGPKQHEVINEKLDALGKHLSLVFQQVSCRRDTRGKETEYFC